MSAPLKRRLPYFISLPAVVAIVLLIVAKLVAMQREDIIADLADQIAHRETADATAAVGQLGSMLRPPAGVLVLAATSGNRDVAKEGQRAVSMWLRRLQQQLDNGRNQRAVAQQLAELAAALADKRTDFDAVDYPWLTATTQRILQIANGLPPKHATMLAVHCDDVLRTALTAEVSDGESDVDNMVAGALAESIEQEVASEEHSQAEAAHLERAIVRRPTLNGDSARKSLRKSTDQDEPLDAGWRGEWTQPVYRIVPDMPPNALPQEMNPAPITPTPNERRPLPLDINDFDHPMAKAATRALLRDWLQAGVEAPSIEAELERRGFNKLHSPLVKQLLSTRAQDRVELVDAVTIEAGLDARAWLVLLADDADAEVRLAAVTAMATSNDVTLIEKAWQTAIHDRDPRVAKLTERLRERRSAVQHR